MRRLPSRLVAVIASAAVVLATAQSATAAETPPTDPSLVVGDANAEGIIAPTTSEDPFEIPLEEGDDALLLGLPDLDAEAVEAPDGEIVFADDGVPFNVEAHTIDVVDEPVLDIGLQVLTVIEDSTAPTRYDFPVEAPLGASLVPQLDGSVELVSTEGAILGIFAAPWAVAADGAPVTTWYEVEDGALVQHVAHAEEGVTYPVVADPAFLVPVAIMVAGRIVAAQAIRVAATRAAAAAAARAVTIRAVSSQVATNALRNFATMSYRTGSHTFRLDRSAMTHILQRHHPSYWTGTNKATQTFFNSKTSITGVRNLAQQVMAANRTTLGRAGTNARVSISAKIGGVTYRMTIDKGRVVQFFPTS